MPVRSATKREWFDESKHFLLIGATRLCLCLYLYFPPSSFHLSTFLKTVCLRASAYDFSSLYVCVCVCLRFCDFVKVKVVLYFSKFWRV